MRYRHHPHNANPPPLPSENDRRAVIVMSRGDAELTAKSLNWAADRIEGAAGRMRGLAPELVKRAARLRRIAAAIDGGAQ